MARSRSQLPRLVQRAMTDLTVIQARLAAAEEHMRSLTATGYPGGGEGGPPSDVVLTGVEAAVLSRWRVEHDHRHLELALHRAGVELGTAVNILTRYPGVGTDPAEQWRHARCDGEMDPTCEQLAVTRGKCRRCYDLWRAGHRRAGTAGG